MTGSRSDWYKIEVCSCSVVISARNRKDARRLHEIFQGDWIHCTYAVAKVAGDQIEARGIAEAARQKLQLQ